MELVRKIHVDCPLCNRLHEVEERRHTATVW